MKLFILIVAILTLSGLRQMAFCQEAMPAKPYLNIHRDKHEIRRQQYRQLSRELRLEIHQDKRELRHLHHQMRREMRRHHRRQRMQRPLREFRR